MIKKREGGSQRLSRSSSGGQAANAAPVDWRVPKGACVEVRALGSPDFGTTAGATCGIDRVRR